MANKISSEALHSLTRRMMSSKMVEYSKESRDMSIHWMDQRDALLRLECISEAIGMLDSAWLALEKETERG